MATISEALASAIQDHQAGHPSRLAARPDWAETEANLGNALGEQGKAARLT